MSFEKIIIKKQEVKVATRRICQQEALTSVSKVIDCNLKWKFPFEQRRKGYEKIQLEFTDVESQL